MSNNRNYPSQSLSDQSLSPKTQAGREPSEREPSMAPSQREPTASPQSGHKRSQNADPIVKPEVKSQPPPPPPSPSSSPVAPAGAIPSMTVLELKMDTKMEALMVKVQAMIDSKWHESQQDAQQKADALTGKVQAIADRQLGIDKQVSELRKELLDMEAKLQQSAKQNQQPQPQDQSGPQGMVNATMNALTLSLGAVSGSIVMALFTLVARRLNLF